MYDVGHANRTTQPNQMCARESKNLLPYTEAVGWSLMRFPMILICLHFYQGWLCMAFLS